MCLHSEVKSERNSHHISMGLFSHSHLYPQGPPHLGTPFTIGFPIPYPNSPTFITHLQNQWPYYGFTSRVSQNIHPPGHRINFHSTLSIHHPADLQLYNAPSITAYLPLSTLCLNWGLGLTLQVATWSGSPRIAQNIFTFYVLPQKHLVVTNGVIMEVGLISKISLPIMDEQGNTQLLPTCSLWWLPMMPPPFAWDTQQQMQDLGPAISPIASQSQRCTISARICRRQSRVQPPAFLPWSDLVGTWCLSLHLFQRAASPASRSLLGQH